MAEFVEIKNEDLDNLPIMSAEEAAEKGVTGYRTEEGGPLRITMPVGPTVTMPKPRPKKVVSELEDKVVAPKIMAEPLNVGERKGIVTPSEEIVREPLGKGLVGFKEKKVEALPANLTDRVPVGIDSLGKDVYGTLEEEGKKDIEKQKTPMPYEEFKQKVFSGEISRASKYSSPTSLKIITNALQREDVDPREQEKREKQLKTFYKYSQYFDPTQKTIIPFTREGKFVQKEDDNPRLNDSKQLFAENKLEFYDVIKNKFTNFKNAKDQRLIEQKLLDRISTGNSANSVLRIAIERLNEIPRAIPTIIPYAKYIYDYGMLGFLNPDAWIATQDQREKDVQAIKKVLQDEVNIPLLMDVMNEAVEEGLKIDMEKGRITEDKFKQLTQVQVGDTIYKRQFVNEELAMKILDTSFNQLSDSKKIGVYLFETGTMMGGAGPIARSIGAKTAKENVNKLRDLVSKRFTPKEAQAYSKLNDLEFLFTIKNLELDKMKDVKSLTKSINVKALEDSIQLDAVSKNAKKLMNRAYLAGVKYRSLTLDPDATQAELTSALIMYRRLFAQTVNESISLRSSPILREGLKEIAPLTAAQYVGQEYFTPENMDSFTGELLGVGYYLLGRGSMSVITGRIAKNLDGWGGGIVNNAAKTFEDVMETFYKVTGGKVENAVPKGWLANRTKEDYERLLGEKLNAKQLKSLEWTQNLVKYMGEENATFLMQNLKRDYELRTKLANLFPEVVPEGQRGMTRAEAMDLLSADIGQTSKVQWLQTARAFMEKNLGAFDAANVEGIKQATEYQKSLEIASTAQSKILNRILDAAKEQGIDFRNNDIVQSYVSELERKIAYTKAFNRQYAIDLKEKIQGYITNVERNPSISGKATLIQELKEAELDISGIADNKNLTELDKLPILDKQVKDSYTNLVAATNVVKSNRENIVKHSGQFGNTAEKFINGHLADKLLKARVPFAKLDQEMETTKSFIDISGLVRSLVDDSVEFKDKPLSFFFSKSRSGKKFFDSPLNKNLRKSFKQMAKRTLDDLPDDLKNKLETLATIPPTADRPNPFFIADSIDQFDEFDLVLKIVDNSKNPDLGLENFKPFKATAYEMNIVRSSFRDYAYRIKKQDPDLSQTYMERKDEIDELFEREMPDKAREYKEASTYYKAFIFDDQDIPNDINRIQNGIERTDENPNGFNFVYKENSEPDTLFDAIGNTALKYIQSGGEPEFLKELSKKFKNDARGFQDKTSNFIPVFDLTTPYGVEKLQTFKNLLKEKLYMKVGREYFTVETKTLKGQRKKLIAEREGGYLFVDDLNDRVNQLDEIFEVDIIDTVGGKPQKLSLNPLSDLIEETKDITVLVAKDAEMQTQLKNYIQDLKGKMKTTTETVLKDKKLLEDDLDKIVRTLGDNTFEATPSGFKRFFDKHVIGGSVKRIEEDKKFIVETTKLDKERVDQLYEFMIGNGLLEHGNRRAIPGATFKGFDGETYVYESFENPERIIQVMLDNPNSSAIINTVLSPSHRDNVLNLMDLVNGRRKLASLNDLTVQNTVIRKITHNELASRGYNIARGMVSPLYVTTEFGLRIASQAGVNIMNLAVSNEKAAELLLLVLENPRNVTKADISQVNELIQSFIVEQLTRQGYTVPDFTEEGLQSLREDIEEKKQRERTDETVQ